MYCTLVWGNTYKTHTSNITRLQKRVLKLCNGNVLSPNENLFAITKKIPFSDLYNLQASKLIFKYFHNESSLPRCISHLLKKNSDIHNIHTRSQTNLSLHTHFSRLNVRKFSIKINAHLIWNSIPLPLRQIDSLNLFIKAYKNVIYSNS